MDRFKLAISRNVENFSSPFRHLVSDGRLFYYYNVPRAREDPTLWFIGFPSGTWHYSLLRESFTKLPSILHRLISRVACEISFLASFTRPIVRLFISRSRATSNRATIALVLLYLRTILTFLLAGCKMYSQLFRGSGLGKREWPHFTFSVIDRSVSFSDAFYKHLNQKYNSQSNVKI